MSDAQPKLSYSSASLRVRIEFARAATLASETPPPDLLKRARAKMDSVRTAGEVADYIVFDKVFEDCWTKLRNSNAPENARITLTVAAGAPALSWLEVEKGDQGNSLARISITADRNTVAKVRPEVFDTAVEMAIKKLGVRDRAHDAQIRGLWARAMYGQVVQGFGIGRAPALPDSDKPFSVIANKSRKEIIVVFRDLVPLKQKEQREQLFSSLNQAVKQMNQAVGGTDFKLQKQEFLSGLQQALVGPQFLGVDLPLVLLAAVGVPSVKATSGKSKSALVKNYPGAGRMGVKVSEDRMEATIKDFDLALYDADDFEVNMEWVEKEMQRLGLVTPMPDDLQKITSDAIGQKIDLSGLLIAAGDEGMGGRGPYIHPSFRDAESRTAGNLDEDELDIREIQQRATVSAGALVAEIRYKDAPVAGRTVFGDELPPPEDDELIVRVGDGIVEKKKGKYYAISDGRPAIDKDSITLSKVLVFEGDVNLRSGNIRFDGPVEIKGSIDSGAVVETSGDLIVHGTIRAAFVKSAGSIAVKTGIVTGARGRVYASGDVQAEFIENSNITCGGDLTVVKALLNSQIVCGGRIYVTSKEGVIAGGHLSCKDVLRTTNLGFRNGSITVLDIGVDWRVQNAIRIRQKRFDAVKQTQIDDRASLRELVQRSRAQMTKKHKEKKEHLQMRLQKARLLIEKLELHLQRAQARLTYNEDARIFVVDQMASNVAVTIAGQPVTVTHDTAGVAVTPKRRRGSYIHPIDEIEAMDRETGVAS